LCNASIHLSKFKVWVIPISQLIPARLGQHLFAGSDQRAGAHGWQVSVIHGGLGRRYRDPRFDRLCALARGPDPERTGHA
jgi:hypothetical protein